MTNVNKIKKIIFLYNPVAGNGLFSKNLDRIIEKYQGKGILAVPVRASDNSILDNYFANMNKNTYKEEYLHILAAGGDGTINHCVSAMIKNHIDLPIAIVPAGTANDFAAYFDIPNDVEEIIDMALDGEYKYADIGLVNNQVFISTGAIGPMVAQAEDVNVILKNTFGSMAYYISALKDLPKLKPVKVKITTDDSVIEEEICFMMVLNSDSVTGFSHLETGAEINDGKFDVLVFKKMNIAALWKNLIKFINGKVIKDKKVLQFKSEYIKVESGGRLTTDFDGELKLKLPVEIRILHNKIRVYTKREGKAVNYKLVETEEYERLVEFFVKNGLEFDGDEEVDTDIIKCMKVVDNDDNLLGGAVLAKREGKFIIDGIAVKEQYRKNRIGKMMLDHVVLDVKDRGGKEIYLVARAPGFFAKSGFVPVKPEEAPNFFECKTCPQFQVSCHPEIMKLAMQDTAEEI